MADKKITELAQYDTPLDNDVLSGVDVSGNATKKFPISAVKKMIYGSMYGDDINVTVDIAAAETYYEVPSGLSGGECNGMTFQNSKELKVLTAGKYKVDWSMSAECASAGQYIEGGVMVNTTAKENTVGAAELVTASKKVCLGGTGIIDLAINDLVKLCVENESGTADIVIDHANLTIIRVA
jgi:hypothetical protein